MDVAGPVRSVCLTFLQQKGVLLTSSEEIQELVDRFRQDWTLESRATMESVVHGVDPADRPGLLRRLVEVDLQQRHAAGALPDIEEYARFGVEVVQFGLRTQQLLDSGTPMDETRPLEDLHCAQCGRPLERHSQPNFCSHCGNLSAGLVDDDIAPEFLDEPGISSRFTLKQLIGQGAFGVVYQAWDNRLRRPVALKLPRRLPIGKSLLAREARAASRLRHPGIVRIFDVVETDESVFVISDFIAGSTLSRYRLSHPPGFDEACHLMIKLCEAMDYAHTEGVIHRDLKPSNIVIDEAGQPHILDFGLSRSRLDSSSSPLRPGIPLGTPAFMPPEQARGELDRVGPESDVYSMGVIFYQLVTGQLPFSGDVEDILHDVISSDPPSSRHCRAAVPPAIDAVILKSISKHPDDRYRSAAEMGADIRRYLAGERLQAYPRVDRRVARRWIRKGVLPLVMLLLLAAAAFAVWNWWSEVERRNPTMAVQIDVAGNIDGLVWQRFDPLTGQLVDATTAWQPGASLRLNPGYYRVAVQLASGQRWEVYRTVPEPTSVPVRRAGYPAKHCTFRFKDDRTVVLPGIEFEPLPRDGDAIRISEAAYSLPDSPDVSGYLRQHSMHSPAGWISAREFTLADIQQVFPELQADFVDIDLAIAFCEQTGAVLPPMDVYGLIHRNDIQVPWVNAGLPEWTSTPKPSLAVPGPPGTPALPGSLDEFLYVKSIDAGPPFTAGMPIVSPYAIAVKARLRDPGDEMGFRLFWFQ